MPMKTLKEANPKMLFNIFNKSVGENENESGLSLYFVHLHQLSFIGLFLNDKLSKLNRNFGFISDAIFGAILPISQFSFLSVWAYDCAALFGRAEIGLKIKPFFKAI